MIKREPLPAGVLARLPEARRYLSSQRQVEFAYLFGGLARRRQAAMSDIDIAVYLKPKTDPTRAKPEILGSLTVKGICASLLHPLPLVLYPCLRAAAAARSLE